MISNLSSGVKISNFPIFGFLTPFLELLNFNLHLSHLFNPYDGNSSPFFPKFQLFSPLCLSLTCIFLSSEHFCTPFNPLFQGSLNFLYSDNFFFVSSECLLPKNALFSPYNIG